MGTDISIPGYDVEEMLYKHFNISCDCGESFEAGCTMTDAQHSDHCVIMKKVKELQNSNDPILANVSVAVPFGFLKLAQTVIDTNHSSNNEIPQKRNSIECYDEDDYNYFCPY